MTDHDFEALRAERNKMRAAWEEEMRADGWEPAGFQYDPNACYCACGTGGPCEHDWNGKPYESDDGCTWSETCSRCGMTAIGHSLRNYP